MLVAAISSDDFFNFCAIIPTIISSADMGASGFFEDSTPAFVRPGAEGGDGLEASEVSGTEAVYGGGGLLVSLLLSEADSAGEL